VALSLATWQGKAVDTPVPMDADLDEPADAGYGPIRRKGSTA